MCAALQIERWLRRCGAGNKKGRQLVRTALKQASGMGLNVMRIFAHTTDPNFVLQTAPGEYNEKVPGQPHLPPASPSLPPRTCVGVPESAAAPGRIARWSVSGRLRRAWAA